MHDERDDANLLEHIAAAVKRHGDDALKPDDENERQVVDPRVNGVEKVEPELSAVHQREEQRDHDNGRRNDCARHPAPKVRVADHCDKRLDQRKRRAEAENRDREEEEDGPDVGARHFGYGERVGQEADCKCAQLGAILGPQA